MINKYFHAEKIVTRRKLCFFNSYKHQTRHEFHQLSQKCIFVTKCTCYRYTAHVWTNWYVKRDQAKHSPKIFLDLHKSLWVSNDHNLLHLITKKIKETFQCISQKARKITASAMRPMIPNAAPKRYWAIERSCLRWLLHLISKFYSHLSRTRTTDDDFPPHHYLVGSLKFCSTIWAANYFLHSSLTESVP